MNKQQYDLMIYEYPNFIYRTSCDHGVFFINNHRYMILEDGLPVKLFDIDCEYYGFICKNEFLNYSCCDGKNYQYNFNTKKSRILDVEDLMTGSIYYGSGKEFIASVGLSQDSDALHCKHLETNELCIRDEEEHEQILVQDDFIFTKNRAGRRRAQVNKISCYDKYLKEQWHFFLRNEVDTDHLEIMLYKDTIILNGLYEDSGNKRFYKDIDFEIFGLYQHNGEEKWRVTIHGEVPNCSRVIGDHIYLVQSAYVNILDANDGRLLLKKPIGFGELDSDRIEYYSIFQHNQHIIVTSLGHKALRIFDMQMNLVQQIDYPKPPTDHCFKEFVSTTYDFSTSQDQIYFNLTHYSGLEALAVLKPTTDDPKVIVHPRPNFKHEHILVEGEKGHAYKLSLDESDLDIVESSGEYELMEIAQYCGINKFEPELRDNEDKDLELNHHLIYSLKKSLLPDDAEEKLELMRQRVEYFFKIHFVASALTKEFFEVKIEYR